MTDAVVPQRKVTCLQLLGKVRLLRKKVCVDVPTDQDRTLPQRQPEDQRQRNGHSQHQHDLLPAADRLRGLLLTRVDHCIPVYVVPVTYTGLVHAMCPSS